MKKKRRTHSPEFKARVAMEALKGIKPVHQIASKNEIHQVQVSQWKKERKRPESPPAPPQEGLGPMSDHLVCGLGGANFCPTRRYEVRDLARGVGGDAHEDVTPAHAAPSQH